MSLLSQVTVGRKPKPPRLLIYGSHGVGKSTLATRGKGHLLIATEDGANEIDCTSTPVAKSFDEVIDTLVEVYQNPGVYKIITIDTADWLERLVFRSVCEDLRIASMEELPYAKAYKLAGTKWTSVLEWLDALRAQGVMIILTAHAAIERFENPEGDAYDRYAPKLYKATSALIQEWVDAVLFVGYKTYTATTTGAFGKKSTKGVGTGERVIKTEERPYHLAKNHYRLPYEIDMPVDGAWETLMGHIVAGMKDEIPPVEQPKVEVNQEAVGIDADADTDEDQAEKVEA